MQDVVKHIDSEVDDMFYVDIKQGGVKKRSLIPAHRHNNAITEICRQNTSQGSPSKWVCLGIDQIYS